MNPRYLMTASAALFGAIGFGLLFFSGEVVAMLGMDTQPEFFIQLAATGFLSMAFLDWMGRSAVYGGIYGRPIVIANLTFGFISLTTVAKGIPEYELSPILWIVAGLLVIHTIGFALLMTRPPWNERSQTSDD